MGFQITFFWWFEILGHMMFYDVNFLCFYTCFFTFGFLFSILCFGLGLLFVCRWIIFWITKSQFLNFVPFNKLVLLCIGVVVAYVMSSSFVCKHCMACLCFVFIVCFKHSLRTWTLVETLCTLKCGRSCKNTRPMEKTF